MSIPVRRFEPGPAFRIVNGRNGPSADPVLPTAAPGLAPTQPEAIDAPETKGALGFKSCGKICLLASLVAFHPSDKNPSQGTLVMKRRGFGESLNKSLPQDTHSLRG
jgi:hypothetical protein